MRFVCEICGEEIYGILHANNEILSEADSSTVGCSASEENDVNTPTLCINCGCEDYII